MMWVELCAAVTSYVFLVSWLDHGRHSDKRWLELIMHMMYYRKFINCTNTNNTKIYFKLKKKYFGIYWKSSGQLDL